MTEREEELTVHLLTVLARYLGQQSDEPARSTSLAQRSPTMLAAWAQATHTRGINEHRRLRAPLGQTGANGASPQPHSLRVLPVLSPSRA